MKTNLLICGGGTSTLPVRPNQPTPLWPVQEPATPLHGKGDAPSPASANRISARFDKAVALFNLTHDGGAVL
jgi:hypothetical protein